MCESVFFGKTFTRKRGLPVNKKEFATFAMALKTYYPKEQLLPNPQAMELWYQQVRDIPVQIAEMALQKWVSTNKWSPTISELKGMVEKIHWEAYEMVSSITTKDLLPEETRKQYEWIYNVTKPFKNAKLAEPSIGDLMHTVQPLQIGSGKGEMNHG